VRAAAWIDTRRVRSVHPQEVVVPIASIHSFPAAPGQSPEEAGAQATAFYEAVGRRLAEAGLLTPGPEGGLAHLAGATQDGTFQVIEVWRDRQAFDDWDPKLAAALEEVGGTSGLRPELHLLDVHSWSVTPTAVSA
jgi:hypothetical protein